MNDEQRKLMGNLLRSNLLVSTGCTEPIAIAYAAAIARSYLRGEPEKITLRISKNMAKNAMDAGIPNSKFTGAAFVASLGALYANPEDGFQLLEGLSSTQHEIANNFAKSHIYIEVSDNEKPLYIEVVMTSADINIAPRDPCCGNHVKVVVSDEHTNISLIEVDGRIIFKEDDNTSSTSIKNTDTINFSMKEIFEYADELSDLSPFQEAININMKLSKVGKENNWGLNVGKTVPFNEETAISRIISATTSAIDARMAGAPYPAMACTGSGNQGISTTIPVYQTGIEIGASMDKILRAVAVSDLTAIYVKKNLNVLSYLCGAVIANCGASAGITYLLGGNFEVAEYAVKNVLSSVVGMFCDGAKSTCAIKVLACVTTAIYSAFMAQNENSRIKQKVGIACESLVDTVKNVAMLEAETSQTMDNTIMKIIVK